MSFRQLSYSDITDLKKLLRAHLDPTNDQEQPLARAKNTAGFISQFQQRLHINIQQKDLNKINEHKN